MKLINFYNRRDEFFQALKKVYFEMNGENLPIYGIVSNILDNPLVTIKCIASSQVERLRNL